MSTEFLQTLWFILIAVLWIGFFFLEGFDYGVGILLPFLGKEDRERREIINTIGPFWDGNEVWLITAGGAMFAAFPNWYATMFSGFYLALVLMLLALIARGVAFEFRSKDRRPAWRRTWDMMIFLGSLIPAVLWGIAMGNLIRGVPIDANMNYTGGFLNLLNPFALMCGLTALLIFAMHGAIFLSLKAEEVIEARAATAARRLWPYALASVVITVVVGFLSTNIFDRAGAVQIVFLLITGAALLAAGWLIFRGQNKWAFITTGILIASSTITLFATLFPRVMISSLNPDWSLTIYNASSGSYTLKVMSIIALIFVPIVLLYQGWSYYVFRERIGRESKLEY
ncbi:MAG TPA: cytochrome d ubiquinol oxidase subunit II [Anaerolineae bacterium]|nr:cytochrome d ubiquinol oxidase subunit II [Anaerolineae bacterium]